MSVTDKMVAGMFDLVGGDNDAIRAAAKGSTVNSWRNWQAGKAAAAGGLAGLIPVVGYVTIPADVAYAIRLMHRTAQGICAIELDVADEHTFSGVLAVWAGSLQLTDELGLQISAKILAQTSIIVGGTVGVQLAVSALTQASQILVAKKITPKLAVQVAALLGAQLTSKVIARWIPVVSAVASGAVNYWIVDSISDSAIKYADFIKKHTPSPLIAAGSKPEPAVEAEITTSPDSVNK